jgi:hypothetical protein
VTDGARPEALERALAVTRELRERVEAGDWGAAAELESERRRLLESFFARRPAASDLARVLGMLRELVASNDALIGLAEHRQRAVTREADTIATGRRAVRAYGDVA